MSHDPQVIRSLTERYGNLRGLAWLPMALWFFVTHSARSVGVNLWPVGSLILAIAAGAAAVAIQRYYDRRFGVVVAKPARWGAGTWVLMLIAFVALEATSGYLALPVHLGFLAIGIAIAAYALRRFELEGQRLLVALIFVWLAFWGRSIFDPPTPLPPWYWVAAATFDMILIVVALLDHRALVKALERARGPHTGQIPLESR
jgi:hypothetical protein